MKIESLKNCKVFLQSLARGVASNNLDRSYVSFVQSIKVAKVRLLFFKITLSKLNLLRNCLRRV